MTDQQFEELSGKVDSLADRLEELIEALRYRAPLPDPYEDIDYIDDEGPYDPVD